MAVLTDRKHLIAIAAVGVVAAVVGIGASIAGVDDRRDDRPAPTTATTAPPGEEEDEPAVEEDEEAEEAEEAAEAALEAAAAVGRDQAIAIARERVAGPVDRARISDEGGTVTWEVRIDTENGHTDVVVDASTGTVVEVDD